MAVGTAVAVGAGVYLGARKVMESEKYKSIKRNGSEEDRIEHLAQLLREGKINKDDFKELI